MKRNYFLTLILIVVICLNVKSQHDDSNQNYINSKLNKSNKYSESDFYNGLVYIKGDSLCCRIYLKKGKVTKDSYLYIVTKSLDDSVVYYSAKEIDGYKVNGHFFMSHNTIKENIKSYFFIKLVNKGRITLYSKEPTPNDKEFSYYMLFPNNKLYYIAPFSENLIDIYRVEGKVGNTPQNTMNIRTNRIDEKFKIGFSILLSDCPQIVNKISSGFYGIYDIEKIVKEYNQIMK